MADYLGDVSIIGAGLGGCALALALSQRNVPTTIYEARPEISDVVPSGVVLTPNGLRVLDRLGVFERIRDRCYIATHRVFKNDQDETTKKLPLGGPDAHGYWNHRIWRSLLLDEMKLMLRERCSLSIKYDSKFNGIVSEDAEGVTFRINDETHRATLIIGSDGLHSTVRKYLAPDIEPEYTGLLGVIGHIRWDSVDWPWPDYEKNATIQGTPGAIFWIAEDARGEEIMIGHQVQWPELSRKEIEQLQRDKDRLVEIYRRGYDGHGPTARSIIDSVAAHKDTLYTWPFMRMPKIPKWYGELGRVVLCGDGAHALPPSSGQGVNQALEDVYSLTLLLTSDRGSLQAEDQISDSTDHTARLLELLAFWQRMRQDRIDAVYDWTANTNNVARLPEAERRRLIADGKIQPGQGDDTGWLFDFDVDFEVNAWLERRQ